MSQAVADLDRDMLSAERLRATLQIILIFLNMH